MARGRKPNAPKSVCELCHTEFVNIHLHQRACRRKTKVVGDAEELAEHFRAGPSNPASHPYAAPNVRPPRPNPLFRIADYMNEDPEIQPADLDGLQDQAIEDAAPAPAPYPPPPLAVIFPDDTPDTPTEASASTAPTSYTAETFPLPTLRPPTLVNAPELVQDDFLTVHHPRSQLPPTIHHFNDFVRSVPDVDPTKISQTPWEPFKSRIDFEFADFTQKASLNQGQIDELIGIISRIVEGPSDFSVKSSGDLKDTWETAADRLPAYTQHTVSKTYKKEEQPREFSFHCRPLFEWGLSLLADPVLASKFAWHGVRHYKYNGETWERFIDEPNTADAWWDLQSVIPADGSPLCFEVYADKTRLSSFGTQKGYPIMARVANLPSEIRNGTGYGGTEIVGFLPIVESEAEEGKKGYTNFKRAIWHESFKILVHTVSQYAKTGYKFRCGDDVERILYPVIIMLVADYEEQAIMTLTRGSRGLCPCPVCLVPQDQQSTLGVQPLYPLRQHSDAQPHVENKNLNKGQLEQIIQPLGIRPIENVFWSLPYANVHGLVSWDRLHAYHGGLFSDHIFAQFQEIVKDLGRPAMDAINARCDLIPRWRDLNHFSEVCTVNFTDGTKYEDISKILVPSSYKVLTPRASKRGHLLLRTLRIYNKLDVLSGLEVHREYTIRMYAAGLVELSESIQVYSAEYPDKNWNFPKFHTHQHLIQDILSKGASKHYNAKTFEGNHRPVKLIYSDQTNFKDVEKQVTRIQHRQTVAKAIRFHIALYDDFLNPKKATETQEILQFQHIHLGSQHKTTCAEVEQQYVGDPAFRRFRLQLEEFLNTRIERNNSSRNWIKILPKHQLLETRYIRVDYESVVNWKQDTDHLRCNPSFWNAPRYDHIIYRVDDTTLGFAHLLFVFVCSFNGIEVPLAFVQFLDVVKAPRSSADRGMGLHRVHRSPANPPDFILVTSIVRGALIMEDLDEEGRSSGDFLVNDLVDGDMFLRLEKEFPGWGT